jgi:hypothetical protein
MWAKPAQKGGLGGGHVREVDTWKYYAKHFIRNLAKQVEIRKGLKR